LRLWRGSKLCSTVGGCWTVRPQTSECWRARGPGRVRRTTSLHQRWAARTTARERVSEGSGDRATCASLIRPSSV
jgi:hypothetical protein